MTRLIPLLAVALFTAVPLKVDAASDSGTIQWQDWSAAVFERAREEGKLVLLDLEAGWCHWCHVMDQTTYRDPEVIDLIGERYIPVRADQDAHPDLSNRYEDYGWPATVIFDGTGTEILKKRGYIRPQWMLWTLQAVAENPSPDAHDNKQSVPEQASRDRLSDEQRQVLNERYEYVYDAEFGGWGRIHKFIHGPSMEYALARAKGGSKLHEVMARQTLQAARFLFDPEWGGVYQYSDTRDWQSRHFEKIMSMQAQYMRLYALAHSLLDQELHLESALAIHRYLTGFLKSPQGAFYTSQDADLSSEVDGHAYYLLANTERRKRGMPPVDTNIYARENGWVISALAALYAATGEEVYLSEAERAAIWIQAHRGLPGGGFRHGETLQSGPFLGDTLAMGRAFLDLYGVTGDRKWLRLAEAAARFIGETFLDAKGAGFTTSPAVAAAAETVLRTPVRHQDSNIEVARFNNLLWHYTGENSYRGFAENAMRYLASPVVTEQRRLLAGVLLTDRELDRDPAHITILGRKDDPAAQRLFAAAIRYPLAYKRVEWWDRREGKLPNPDVVYPQLARAAAFACANQACSLPVFEPEQIVPAVDRLQSQ